MMVQENRLTGATSARTVQFSSDEVINACRQLELTKYSHADWYVLVRKGR